MPGTISLTTAMNEFDDMVQEELMNSQKLAGTCREYDTEGQNFNVPFFDQLALEQAAFDAGDIPIKDVTQRNVQIVQGNHRLKTTIGYAYETLFNYDVVMGHVRQHAAAIGRFNDKLKLDAIVAADASFTAGNNNLIAAGTLLVTNLIDAKYRLIDNGADPDELSMYTSAKNMKSFFNDSDFKSWDQNSNRPLMKGSIGFFGGVDIRVLGSASAANTLPGGATTPSNYVVEKDSLAVAYNRRPVSKVIVEESEDRVSVLTTATAGSAVLRVKGICKLTTTL